MLFTLIPVYCVAAIYIYVCVYVQQYNPIKFAAPYCVYGDFKTVPQCCNSNDEGGPSNKANGDTRGDLENKYTFLLSYYLQYHIDTIE